MSSPRLLCDAGHARLLAASLLPLPRLASLLLLLALAALGSGCFLPIATGSPQKAETMGAGRYGTSFSAELPNLNLTAADEDSNPDTSELVIAPAASMSFGLQYGLADHVDLELTIDGAMYLFLLPLPLGVSGGVRAQAYDSPGLDVAVAGRLGYLGLSAGDGESNSDAASAYYGVASGVVQIGSGAARPGLAVTLVSSAVPSACFGGTTDCDGLSTSATMARHLGRGRVSIAPFVSLTHFASADLAGASFFSGGIAIFVGERGAPPAQPTPLGGNPGPYPGPGPGFNSPR